MSEGTYLFILGMSFGFCLNYWIHDFVEWLRQRP
jgi:hypothetical protein